MAYTFISKHRYARISSRKVRLVIDLIRGHSVPQAMALLKHSPKRGAAFVYKVLRAAWESAQNDDRMAEEGSYFVSSAFVNEGPTIYRGRSASMGRYVRIRKRTSHIQVEISSKK